MRRWLIPFTLSIAVSLTGAPMLSAQEEPPPGETLENVSVEMAIVTRGLNKKVTGKPTQKRQKEIIGQLDTLILLLEKQVKSGQQSGASNANPSNPLADSVIMGGPGGRGDLHAPKGAGKKWGQLPAKQRQKILQAMTEGFPPHYRVVLERYYRRLAEEQTAADAAPIAKPNAAPNAVPAAKPNVAPAAKPARKSEPPPVEKPASATK